MRVKASPAGSEDRDQASPSLGAEGASSLATSDIHSVDTPGVGGYHEGAASREASGAGPRAASGAAPRAAAPQDPPGIGPKGGSPREASGMASKPAQPAQPKPPPVATKLSVIMPRRDGSGSHASSRLGPTAPHSHPQGNSGQPQLPRQPSSLGATPAASIDGPRDSRAPAGRADGSSTQGLQRVQVRKSDLQQGGAAAAASSSQPAAGAQAPHAELPRPGQSRPSAKPEQQAAPLAHPSYGNLWDDDRPLSFPKALARKRT